MEFGLAYYNVAVQHVNHYASGILMILLIIETICIFDVLQGYINRDFDLAVVISYSLSFSLIYIYI